MASRDEILQRVRRVGDGTIDPPQVFTGGLQFPDPVAQFANVLVSVGGQCEFADDLAAAGTCLEGVEHAVNAKSICSRISGLGRSTFDATRCVDPHDVEHLDMAIFPGEIAVAENAAIWVASPHPVERAMLFLTQHLVMIVSLENVVHNLHDAYARVDVTTDAFGCWISGPSKTADIEQSLVIGAHGPRSLTVVLLGRRVATHP